MCKDVSEDPAAFVLGVDEYHE